MSIKTIDATKDRENEKTQKTHTHTNHPSIIKKSSTMHQNKNPNFVATYCSILMRNCHENSAFRLQFHSKALLKERVSVTSATTETDHGILFIWLILLTTNQALVPETMGHVFCCMGPTLTLKVYSPF